MSDYGLPGGAGFTAYVADRDELVRLASAIVGSRAVAEELVQESWLRWRRHEYPDHGARRVFRQIVQNLSLDWLRRQRLDSRSLTDPQLRRPLAMDTQAVVISRQDFAEAVAALAELPDRTRQAFYLSRIDELTYAEIGEKLRVSAPRVHQMVRAALLHVSKRLDR